MDRTYFSDYVIAKSVFSFRQREKLEFLLFSGLVLILKGCLRQRKRPLKCFLRIGPDCHCQNSRFQCIIWKGTTIWEHFLYRKPVVISLLRWMNDMSFIQNYTWIHMELWRTSCGLSRPALRPKNDLVPFLHLLFGTYHF